MPLIKKNQKYQIGKHSYKFSGKFQVPKPIYYEPRTLNQLYQNCLYIFPLLDKLKVKYWAIGGTLLGAVRHQTLIPWDIDIDLAITADEYFRLCSIMEALNLINPDYQWVDMKCPGIRVYYQEKAVIDLFTMDYLNKTTLAYSDYYRPDKTPTFFNHHVCFPKIKVKSSEIFPLKKYKFNDLKINGPRNAFAFLRVNYNDSCLKVVIGPNQEHKNLHTHITENLKWSILSKFTFEKIITRYPNVFSLIESKLSYKFNRSFQNYGVNYNEKKKKINYFKMIYEIPICFGQVAWLTGIRGLGALIASMNT